MASIKELMETASCGYKCGDLPSCAPLSAGYVPFQRNNPPQYSNTEALTKGTLFPGLDLPFMNKANKSNPYAGTPLGDLMALDFVLKELNLYLDTHPDDAEAFELFKKITELRDAGMKKYIKIYGPVKVEDTTLFDEYNWLRDPWPWDYKEESEG